MSRSFASAVVFAVLATSASARHDVGQDPKGPADSRRTIVKQVQDDLDSARAKLNQNDPGAETRRTQKRIVAGLDELIEQQNEHRGGNSSSSAKKSKNAVDRPPAPQPAPASKQPVGRAELPSTPADLRQQKNASESWPGMPPRLRQEMDAFARERFIRNYEELLRAYYRTLAESGRGDSRE